MKMTARSVTTVKAGSWALAGYRAEFRSTCPERPRCVRPNPNDSCCRSCGSAETSPPDGCAALATDPGCGAAPTDSDDVRDATNLRCFDQKQRFGFDLLYPTSRYVDALTNPLLTLQSDGKTKVVNPLFDTAGTNQAPRRTDFGVLGGHRRRSLARHRGLFVARRRWAQVLERRGARHEPPLADDPRRCLGAARPYRRVDPFMVETPAPRSGMNPITTDLIMPASSTSQTASPINGHEQNLPNQDDLQYACTFKLTTPKSCTLAGDAALRLLRGEGS